jgi:hypothetical protein
VDFVFQHLLLHLNLNLNLHHHDEDEEDEEEQLPYCPSTPYSIDLDYDRRDQQAPSEDEQESYYQAMFNINDIPKFNPSFELPPGVEPSAAALLELFFPDTLLDKWVQCTNAYAASLLPPTKHKRVIRSDILCFLATITYMGVCHLPAKEDYFPGY